MAKSTTGKWVSRVGASGGGKAYRKSRPSNYYGALAVIVVLGTASTLLARYDYEHPHHTIGTPPAVGTTWYAALRIEACGQALSDLAPNPNYLGGFRIQTSNVIRVSPASAADAGSHATVGQFANEYPGLIISSSELAVPTATGVANAKTTYHNGDVCPKGSKYAGQSGKVSYAYWTSFGQAKPTVTTNPGSIKFRQYLRLTMAFDPAGVTPQPPSKATVDAMVSAVANPTTTTVPTLGTTTTLSHSPTTTTPTPATSTTAATTTTAPKG
ncbi:MAG: hypothetical protein ACHQFZ_07530 [Acidimicrobiales bacterium]